MTTRRREALPVNLAPIGLSRDEAAAYIGVGTGTFDKMVADGRMPRPKAIERRLVWDRRALDSAFTDLPHAVPAGQHPATETDQWDRVAV